MNEIGNPSEWHWLISSDVECKALYVFWDEEPAIQIYLYRGRVCRSVCLTEKAVSLGLEVIYITSAVRLYTGFFCNYKGGTCCIAL